MISDDFDAYFELYTEPFTIPTSIEGAKSIARANAAGIGFNAAFSHDLTAGNNYHLASSSLSALETGSYTTTINGPVAAVPEPETYAMFLAGLGLLGFATRRKA